MFLAAAILSASLLSPAAAQSAPPLPAPHATPFLVDDTHTPHITISWPTASRKTLTLEGDRPYTDPTRRQSLGHNLECYVAPGGTRLDVGAADPAGAIIRVGFYKTDGRKLLFEDLARDSAITITLRGVVFNHPATPRPATLFQHAKFDDPGSVLGCAASAAKSAQNNLIDLYNTVDRADTLGGRITPKNGRLGILDSTSTLTDHGCASLTTEADGSVTMTVTIPYALFKHPEDPWLRSNPGDFTEPFHFHIEYEAVPSPPKPDGNSGPAAKAGAPAPAAAVPAPSAAASAPASPKPSPR